MRSEGCCNKLRVKEAPDALTDSFDSVCIYTANKEAERNLECSNSICGLDSHNEFFVVKHGTPSTLFVCLKPFHGDLVDDLVRQSGLVRVNFQLSKMPNLGVRYMSRISSIRTVSSFNVDLIHFESRDP